jgi:uncharacterized alpha-E superfamily protein
MLSRVADSIYWMARYVERAENLSRLILSTQNLLLDAGAEGSDSAEFWGPILMTTGEDEAYAKLYPQISGDSVVRFLSSHPANPNSIANCVRAARENARTVRDQISDELWDSINSLRLFVEDASGDILRGAGYFERVLRGSYEFQGVAGSTTHRGEHWFFLRMGTCIERADQTSRLLDTCSGLSMESSHHEDSRPLRWAALLRSCSAWHAYQVESARLDPRKIIDFLLLNESFPRSVACNVTEVHRALTSLCGARQGDVVPEPVRQSGRLRADLNYTNVTEILAVGLHDYIDELQTRLNDIGIAIFNTFVFYSDPTPSHPLPPAQLAGAWHASDDSSAVVQQQQQQQ